MMNLKFGGWTRATSATLMAFVCGCSSAETQDPPPDNGQTGSPGIPVPPDYDNPGFRPPERDPGTPGPSPTFPERPLSPPEQAALSGSTLYLAQRERGVLLYDVSDAQSPEPLGSLDVSGMPHWVYTEGERLFVVSTGIDVENQRVVDRLIAFDIHDASNPVELARVDLQGGFRAARPVDGAVVILTALAEDSVCSEEYGPNEGWIPTTHLQFSRYAVSGGELKQGEQLNVEGDGYFELASGFAVSLGPDEQTTALRFVEIAEGGTLTAFDAAEFEQSLLASAPMQHHGEVLRVFERTGAEVNLTELQLSDPTQRRSLNLPIEAPGGYPYGNFTGSAFSGDLALVSISGLESSGDAEVHARVVSFAGEQPEIAFTFDQPISWFFPLDREDADQTSSWLGFSQNGYTDYALHRIQLSADGSAEVLESLSLPENVAGNWGAPLWLDGAGEQVLIPYFVEPPAEGVHFAHVSLGKELEWQADDSFVFAGLPPTLRAPAETFFWLEQGYGQTARLSGIVNLGSGSAPKLIQHATGRDLIQMSGSDEQLAAVERRADETWLVHGRGKLDHELKLDHAATTLSGVGDVALVGALNTQSDCEEEMGEGCEQVSAGFSVVDITQNEVLGQFELPRVDIASGRELSAVIEWMEVVHTPEGAGLIQRRGYSCRSQSACEDNDIPYEWETDFGGGSMDQTMNDGMDAPAPEPVSTQRAQGQIDELWLYPIDLEKGELQDPRLLDRLAPYEFVTAQDFVQQRGYSLLAAHDVNYREGFAGIESVKLSLLVSPESSDAAAPLRGWPLAVLDQAWTDAPVVISIEPAGVSESEGDDESQAPSSKPSTSDTLHQLVVDGQDTYLRASLSLGQGYRRHAWGNQQGYVLSQSADRCDESRFTTLSVIQVDGDGLTRRARFELEGHDWEFMAQTDERVVLQQYLHGINRLAVLDVSGEPEVTYERVFGGAWFSARQAVIIGERVYVATRTGGLETLE